MHHTVVDEPLYAAETTALLARFDPARSPGCLAELIADRAEPPDPELAGAAAPDVRTAEMYLPARGGPLPVRVYRPSLSGAARPRPLVLWLHGGGFIGGTVDDIEHLSSGLARAAEMTVVSLDYRLAPEHPYPAALHDTVDAIAWLSANGEVLGGDGRVAAGGQSAGAALVAGACLLARDENRAVPARQVLCYPSLDFGRDSEAAREHDGVFHSTRAGWADAQYLAGQPVTAYAAPLRAADLTGLPPALILGAGRDPLRDDARAYASRLNEARVEVAYVEYAGTMHAFLNFCGVLSAGDHAIGVIAAYLRAAFDD